MADSLESNPFVALFPNIDSAQQFIAEQKGKSSFFSVAYFCPKELKILIDNNKIICIL